jgi:L-amino acid N-acyltransferase YncA
MRGKGLGKLMVKSATGILDSKLKARVKQDNKASLMIATYSGFKEIDKEGNFVLFRLEKLK